jgi:hypothetical protein
LREQFDTTLPRFDLMAQLERAPDGLQMGELSRRMMVTGGNVTGITDRSSALTWKATGAPGAFGLPRRVAQLSRTWPARTKAGSSKLSRAWTTGKLPACTACSARSRPVFRTPPESTPTCHRVTAPDQLFAGELT